MHTESHAKALPKKARQSLEEAIRKEFCPDISYDQWLEIEKAIIDGSKIIQSHFWKLMPQALGLTSDKDKDVIMSLEAGFNDSKIDLEEIKKSLPNDSSEETKKLLGAIEQIQKLDRERKSGQ